MYWAQNNLKKKSCLKPQKVAKVNSFRVKICMLVKYIWTGFVCCERYIFKYLELKEKEKRGEGRKKSK